MSFESIMTLAIEEMEKNAKRFEDDKAGLSPFEFVKVFRTVHLGYGRRTGKSRYIIESATENDLILIHRKSHAIIYSLSKAWVSSDLGLHEASDKPVIFSTVYIDEPYLHSHLESNLEKLIRDTDQTVIKVGA